MNTAAEEHKRLARDLTKGIITKEAFDIEVEKLENKPVTWIDYNYNLYEVKRWPTK